LPIFLVIIYALVGLIAIIGVIAFVHFMVVFSSWCKAWYTAWKLGRTPREPSSPSETQPLRPKNFNSVVQNAVNLPVNSVLFPSSENIPLTTFSQNVSNRNSIATTILELSDEEYGEEKVNEQEQAPKICGAKLMKSRPAKPSSEVATPQLPAKDNKTNPVQDASGVASIFQDTVTFVREKYANFTKTATMPLPSTSVRSEEEWTIVDLLVTYPPHLPFLTPRSKEEKEVFGTLAFAQQQLHTVEVRAEKNQLRQDNLQAEYNWHQARNTESIPEMDKCLEGEKFCFYINKNNN
jgi:hypothetical protein